MSLVVLLTWPRITAEPIWPGVGKSWYQPAGDPGSPDGVWTSPFACFPTGATAASTPMEGTSTRTGTEAGSGASGVAGLAPAGGTGWTGGAGGGPVGDAGPDPPSSADGAAAGGLDTAAGSPVPGGSAWSPRPMVVMPPARSSAAAADAMTRPRRLLFWGSIRSLLVPAVLPGLRSHLAAECVRAAGCEDQAAAGSDQAKVRSGRGRGGDAG